MLASPDLARFAVVFYDFCRAELMTLASPRSQKPYSNIIPGFVAVIKMSLEAVAEWKRSLANNYMPAAQSV